LIQLSNDGTLTLPLKPIIVDIKAALVKQGVGFANAIPEVDKSITLGKIPELALARVIYQVGVGVGTWLPWIVALMFAVGIFAARNRPRAIMATSIVFALVMGFMGFLFGTGRIVATTVIDPAIAGAVAVIYDAVVAYVINVVAALGVVAVFVAIAAWAFGSSESAAKLRAFSNKQIDTVRKAVDPQNKTFSGVSPVMNKYRVLARVLIIGIIAWIVALQQPVTVPMIIWNTLLILVLLFVYEVLQRTNGKPVVAAAAAAPSAPVAPAPSTAKPAAKKVPAKKPAAQATTSAKPTAKKTTAAKPAAKKAPAKKPVAKKPAAKKS
jgi:MFS family permease